MNSYYFLSFDQTVKTAKMRLTSRVAKALSGKTAIVTASTDGIGFAIAKRLAQDGAKVWISSRKQENVDSALEELRGMDLDVDGMGMFYSLFCLK